MKMRYLVIRTVMMSVVLGEMGWADDKLLAVDAKGAVMVVQRDGATQVIRVEAKTEILLNNKKATLQELTPGASVRVRLADAQTATRIEAAGMVGTVKPVVEVPPMRSLTVRVKADGTDLYHFDGQTLRIEHDSAKLPEGLIVNGREWMPQWQEGKSAELTVFDPPLGPLGAAHPTFKKISGRGKVAVVKSEEKTTHSVKLEDDAVGADVYEFRWSW